MTAFNRINSRRLRDRDGVTLVEVLTSITVAVIGVAGVLILIPFATRQGNVGLDLDASATVANNAAASLEIGGHTNITNLQGQLVLPWAIPRQSQPQTTPPPPQPNSSATLSDPPLQNSVSEIFHDQPLLRVNDTKGVYWIDPLFLSRHLDSSFSPEQQADVFDSLFSYVGEATPPAQDFDGTNISFDDAVFAEGSVLGDLPAFAPTFVHLLDTSNPIENLDIDGDGIPDDVFVPRQMPPAVASRMFINRDGLEFTTDTAQNGAAIDPLDPPRPSTVTRVGVDGDGNPEVQPLHRQFRGDISWNALAVSRRNPGNIGSASPAEGFDMYILVYKDRSLVNPATYNLTSTGTDGFFTPGLPSEFDPRYLYAPVVVPPAMPNDPTIIQGNGDDITLNTGGIDIRNDEWLMLINYDINGNPQVGFYRVIGSLNTGAQPRVLIDGPEFTLQRVMVDPSTGAQTNNLSGTYAVYLPNVISVYKRQVRFTAAQLSQ